MEKHKYIFTFGSGQLTQLQYVLNPLKVMLVIEDIGEQKARDKVFKSFIGKKFCTSYPYSHAIEFKNKFGMQEYSLETLINLKDKHEKN